MGLFPDASLVAPDVFYDKASDKVYLYYTDNRTIGVAVADTPDGKFIDKGVLIGDNDGDATLFQDDDGKYYLYWAKYFNRIWVQEMADPLTKKGAPKELLSKPDGTNGTEWELPRNEGPFMIKNDGVYYLLYSGNSARTRYYAVGYATSNSPLGPL